MSRRCLAAIALVAVAGCSGRVTSEATDAAIGDASSDTPGEALSDTSSQCATAAEAIARLAVGPFCTSVLRLDYQTLKPLGWNILCGSGPAPTEVEARKSLAPYAPPPFVTAESYAVQPTTPPFPFVFYASAGDFGAVGLVSRRTGFVAFAGGIVWSGRGEIAFPSSWRPASELASGCSGPTRPATDSFILTGAKDTPAAALDAAWSTALPLGLSRVNGLGGAFVLGYPRSVGMFDPSSAEWIVVIESALLD